MIDGRTSIKFAGLLSGLLFFSPAAWAIGSVEDMASSKAAGSKTPIAELPDGRYQFCSEPEPQDWQVGAGTCLNFEKQEAVLEGYYGYPHSSEFVCLKGQVADGVFSGQGSILAQSGRTSNDFSQVVASWRSEGRLSLSKRNSLGHKSLDSNAEDWVIFQQATLDIRDLIAYETPRMTPPAQLCDGQFD